VPQRSTKDNSAARVGRPEASPVQKLRDFMTSTAGIVTALATIVTATATILGVLHHGKSQAQQTGPLTTATTTSVWPNTSASQPSSMSVRIRWGPGNLLVTNNGTSLSNVPPGNYKDVVGDIYSGNSGILPMADTILLLWTSGGQPTPQQCQYLSTTQGDPGQGVNVVPGSVVCAVVADQTIAIMKVKAIDPASATIETRTTIWNLPAS